MKNLVEFGSVKALVTELYWEKSTVYLTVKLDVIDEEYLSSEFVFCGVNGNDIGRFILNIDSVDGDLYHLSLDVLNPGYSRPIPRGSHNLLVCSGENIVALCTVSPDIVGSLADAGRNFLYDGRTRSYCVSFFVDDSYDDILPLQLHTISIRAVDFRKNNGQFKPFNKKKLNFSQQIQKDVARIGRKVLNRPLPIHTQALKIRFYKEEVLKNSDTVPLKKTILFLSEQNSVMSTNQKAVYDRLIERGDDKKFDILFSFRSSVAESQNDNSWRKLLKKLAKADIIIMDDHAPVLDWLVLRPETTVIQIWHAGAGFKSSGYSRWGNKGCPSTYCCHRQYTYGISGSSRIAHFFSEVWGINTEQVLPTGMPRMDEYLDEEYRKATTEKLYESFPLCRGKKVILFAPTYRGKNKALAYYPYHLIDFDRLAEVCSDEYVVLFKVHPWISEPITIPEKYSDIMIDVFSYPNINDLFYITDLLITDYSSSIFEYSLMRKPMLFFAYDEIQYSFSRGFHRPYRESTPGKVVSDFDELLEAIRNKDFEFEKVEEYVDVHFDYIDSHASDRVIDWLIFGNMPEEFRTKIDAKLADAEYITRLRFPAEIPEPLAIDFSDPEELEEDEEEETRLLPENE